MAGAWEITNQESVLVCILHVDFTTVAWGIGLKGLHIPGGIQPITGLPFDHARNSLAMGTLDSGATWCMMLDSDVIPQRDAILKLMAHRQPIVSGMYFRRSPPVGVPVCQRPLGCWVTKYPRNKLFEVDVVGSGCLLIHRDVFQKLPPVRPDLGRHWFSWQVDQKDLNPPGGPTSEDFVFCAWARAHGYKILVDPQVRCKHAGMAEAEENSFVPLFTGALMNAG